MLDKSYTLDEVLVLVRKYCLMCDNGCADVETNVEYDHETGELIGEELTPIECEYCGRLMQEIKLGEDNNG